jgi:hypothetical protein
MDSPNKLPIPEKEKNLFIEQFYLAGRLTLYAIFKVLQLYLHWIFFTYLLYFAQSTKHSCRYFKVKILSQQSTYRSKIEKNVSLLFSNV